MGPGRGNSQKLITLGELQKSRWDSKKLEVAETQEVEVQRGNQLFIKAQQEITPKVFQSFVKY